MINYILTSGNDELAVTGFKGNATVTNLGGVPLGAVGDVATAEVGVKVIVVGGSFANVTIGAVTQSGNWVLSAGTAIVGKIGIDQTTPGTTDRVTAGGSTVLPVSTITFSVGGAAATGDYVGTTTSPQSFASVVRTSGGTGVLQSLTITDKTTTTPVALELWLFSATFTAPTDNAAWDISDANALLCLGVVPIPVADWYTTSSNQVCTVRNIGLPIKPAATSLFYALVARGTTPAWATGDVQITLGILQD